MHRQQILEQIKDITFKDNTKLIDIISNIVIKEKNIGFSIDIVNQNFEEVEEIKIQAQNRLKKIPDIGKITIISTSSKEVTKKSVAPKVKHFIENVKKVILVASGKGGVGKSTIASLIAEQLNSENYRVGLVDADIYGPSIPHIFNIHDIPKIVDDRMMPIISRNIQIMSIGFLIARHSAIVWRGPMASKTIYQLLSVTKWDDLDYLIIDMPPGTGDIHLSILENYHLDGVIMITTPHKLAEIDVIRSIDLYKKLNLPILGIIENMSYSLDDKNSLAEKYNIPLICKIPIDQKISIACDKGGSLADIINIPLKNYI